MACQNTRMSPTNRHTIRVNNVDVNLPDTVLHLVYLNYSCALPFSKENFNKHLIWECEYHVKIADNGTNFINTDYLNQPWV